MKIGREYIRMAALLCVLLFLSWQAPLGAASASENVFAQRNCARCHGLNGNGRVPGAPSVADMQLDGSLLDFGGRLWNHGPAMVKKSEQLNIALPRLEAKDIATLLSFVTAYRSANKDRTTVGDPSRGEIAWKGLKCASCHSLEGNPKKLGNSLVPYKNLSPVQMIQAMWKHSPEMSKALSENGINAPRITGSQMVDILAYIRSRTGMQNAVVFTELGNPLRGADVFRKKQCVTCHPVADTSTQYGPQFERRQEFKEGTAGVAALMWNHSVGMHKEMQHAGLAAPTFEGTEMADLLAYLYLSTYSEEPGDAVLGKKLFELKH